MKKYSFKFLPQFRTLRDFRRVFGTLRSSPLRSLLPQFRTLRSSRRGSELLRSLLPQFRTLRLRSLLPQFRTLRSSRRGSELLRSLLPQFRTLRLRSLVRNFATRRLNPVRWHGLSNRGLIALSILALLVPSLIVITRFARPAVAAWFDDAWGYRQTVAITNAGTAQTDFQVAITLNTSALVTAGKMQSDCDDIRITDIGGNVLPHWIETGTNACNTTTTAIWTKVPSISTTGTTVYLYYGNPSAVSVQNGNNVFTFFDDFSGSTVDTTKWTVHAGVPVVSSGLINFRGGVANDGITSVAMALLGTGNYSMEARHRINSGSNTWNFGFSDAFDGTEPNADDVNFQLCTTCSNTSWIFRDYSDAIYSTQTKDTEGLWRITKMSYIQNTNGIATTYSDDRASTLKTYTTTTSLPTMSLFDRIHFISHTKDADMDWVFIHKNAATLPSVASPTNEEKSEAPVAYWKFDEGYGTNAYDSTQNSNNGTLTNSPTWQSEDQCISGKCLKFDGTDDYVNVPDPANNNLDFGTGSFTISAWVKPKQGLSNYYQIVGKKLTYNGFNVGWDAWLDFRSGGILQLRINDGSTDGDLTPMPSSNLTSLFNSNSWRQVTWVVNVGNNVTFYVDGVSYGSQSISSMTGSISNSQPVTMGGRSGYFFPGFIDEPKIYPYARTPAQIKSDYRARGTSKGTSVQMGASNKNLDALSNGLVGYWKMDEASWTNDCSTTSVTDSSGNGNNGKSCPNAGGITTLSSGKYGNAPDFDGTDDEVNTPDSGTLSVTGALTMSAWIYADVVAADQTILEKGEGTTSSNSYYINTTSSSKLNLNIRKDSSTADDITSTTSLSTGTWTHVVATWDGISTAKLYINGTLDKTATTTITSIQDTTAQFGISGIPNNAAWSYNGKVDEARVYNRALSPKEVRDLYNWAPGPVGYWNFEEGTGGYAQDISGNGNQGTWSGTGSHWATGKFGKTGQFNGTDDYVSTSITPAMAAMTITAWVKSSDVTYSSDGSGLQEIVTKWQSGNKSFDFRMSGGALECLISPGGDSNGETETSTHTLTSNVWVFVACTYDDTANTVSIYKNGVGQTYTNSITMGGTTGIQIGRLTWTGTTQRNWNGTIDDVRIYNYARTSGQIIEDMNAGHPLGGSPVGSQVGYWKFDEGYGATTNNSGSGGTSLNGVVNNATWTNNGKFGKALSFDGTGDYVGITHNQGNNIKTVSAWFKLNSLPTGIPGGIVLANASSTSGPTGFDKLLRITTSGKIEYYFHDGSGRNATGTTTLVPGVWYYAAGVTEGSRTVVYLNGKEEGSYASVSINSGNYAIIDFDDTAYSSYAQDISGVIDEVKLYNAALTEDEIKLDYNRGAAMVLGDSTEQGLIKEGLILNLDSTNTSSYPGSGTTWYDISGSSNDFTIEGALQFDAGQGFGDFGSGKRIYRNSFPQNLKTSQGGQGYTVLIWAKSTGGQGGWRKPLGNNDGENYIDLYQNSGSPYAYTTEAGETLFVDGVQYANNTYVVPNSGWHLWGATNLNGGGTSNPVGALTIGNEPNGTSYPWIGKIAIVRLYNRVLAPGDMKQIYDLEAGKFGLTNTGPVGEWNFEEGSGTAANDTSGNGNTGTWSGIGAQHWISGKIGKAGNFNGTDDKVQMASLGTSGTNSFSISGWIKVGSQRTSYDVPIWNGVDSTTAGFGVGYRKPNSMVLYAGWGSSTGEVTGPTATAGNWYHVASTYDGSTHKFYVNGILQNFASYSSSNFTSGVFNLGSLAGSYFSNDTIDQVRIYNYARTPAQIAYDYNRGAPVAHWKLDECQGITANDSSGNGNTGTITIGATGTNTSAGTCTGSAGEAWKDGAVGKYNSSLEFDGTDDYVDNISDSPYRFSSGDFTLSSWIKQTSGYTIIGKGADCSASGSEYVWQVNGSGFYFRGAWRTSSALNISTGTWVHQTIVFTDSDDVIKIYNNGVLAGTITGVTGTYATSTGYLRIAKQQTCGNYFNGQIDDVKIFNYALTPSQIKNVYNEGSSVRFGP